MLPLSGFFEENIFKVSFRNSDQAHFKINAVMSLTAQHPLRDNVC